MIIEAQTINGVIVPKHEITLECANCGSEVDAVEYAQNTCNDCGNPWDEKRHISIYATSIPLSGSTF